MNSTNTANKPTGTDWARVKREAALDVPIAHDEANPYDPNDSQAVAAFWGEATIKPRMGRPPKEATKATLNMRIDADVLDAFRATGKGWQTRMNTALKDWLKNHSPNHLAG